jgi:Serpentine type 7TM GPCR chemoreceptor Srw
VEVTSRIDPTSTVTWLGCVAEHAQFVRDNINVYFNVYYWFRVIFIHLVPCSVLVVLNGLLVQAMRLARRRRLKLLSQNRKSECRRLAESNLTTMMLVAVVGLFLVVEVPLAGLLIVLIVDNTFDLDLLDEHSRHVSPLFVNLCILLSYPLNFFVYCGMSRQFRESFQSLVCGGGGRRGADSSGETAIGGTTIGLSGPDGGNGGGGGGNAGRHTAVSRLSDVPVASSEAGTANLTCFVVGHGTSAVTREADASTNGGSKAQYVSMTRLP